MSQLVFLSRNLIAWVAAILIVGALEDWPQWRGPHRDGQVAGFKAPAVWPEQLSKQWQVEVGEGHASPVIVDSKIYIFTRRDERETLACLNVADGKQQWRQSYAAPYEANAIAAAHGKGPKSTPAVADGRVFTLGISGIVSAFDAKNGRVRWRKEYSKQFESTSPSCGASMSPVVEDGKCIVHVGGNNKGALLALDVENGDTLWSWNEDGPGYASPVVATLDGVRQVITQTQKWLISVDLADGKLLWRVPYQTEYDQNIVTVLVHEGSVIVSGYNKGVDRYRVEKHDGAWQTDKIWENKEVSLFMSSPVADAERLFGFSQKQKGQLFALDLTTGKTLWTSEGRLGENAAVIQAGNVLFALTSEGELIVFRADDKRFRQLAKYHVDDTPTWAHLVVLAHAVLVKSETALTMWQVP